MAASKLNLVSQLEKLVEQTAIHLNLFVVKNLLELERHLIPFVSSMPKYRFRIRIEICEFYFH